MDPTQYTTTVAVDEVAGNPLAVYVQVVLVAEHHPHRLREVSFIAANAVGGRFCTHLPDSLPLPGGLTLGQRQEVPTAHAGLCGYYHCGVIASVQAEDIDMRGEATGNRFRNQACFDAARQLNAREAGVQVDRKECFMQACLAVFPGSNALDAAVGAALRNG